MNHLILILFFTLYSTGAAPQNNFSKKLNELYEKESPETYADKARVACIAVMCHFEDKKGCQNACRTYGQLRLPEDQMTEVKVTSEIACAAGCVINLRKDDRATGVCKLLCSVDFSYPNRKKWRNEIDEALTNYWKHLPGLMIPLI